MRRASFLWHASCKWRFAATFLPSWTHRVVSPVQRHGPLAWPDDVLQIERRRHFPGVFVEFREHFLDALRFPLRMIVLFRRIVALVIEFVTYGQVRVDDELPVVDH